MRQPSYQSVKEGKIIMVKIAVLDDYQNVARQMADWDTLPDSAELVIFNDHLDYGETLIERLRDFAVICAMRERTPFNRELLRQLPNLKLLLTAGMQNASIDVAAAGELGIMVCGSRSPGHATAELTWGLILSLMRHIPQDDKKTRAGHWQTTLGNDLHGKTLGVIGLGRLGSQVATVGKVFGMNVIAWSQNLDPEQAAKAGVSAVEKDQLLTCADIVTIHLRLSERTRGLIGARELALMKPTAYLVNTSRGPIIDEAALIAALQNHKIGGAGLDVYDIEPITPDHVLLQLENTVITPHLGFVTEETYRVFYGEMLEDIIAYLNGAPIRILKA
jgi:phosphoglycerate dehydrogenase-like enzyme